MTRIFDLLFSFFGLLFLSPLLLLLWAIAWFDNRSPLFRQERVGRNQVPFVLVKFRTMRSETPSVATLAVRGVRPAAEPIGHLTLAII